MKRIRRFFLKWLLILMLLWLAITVLLVLPFRWFNPPVTMVMAERWIGSTADYQLKKTWLSWDEIPKQAALAVVASEDQRFPLHSGFDVDAIMSAIEQSSEGGQLRGASTISQQVAKNMYLWTGRSWVRKGLEVWFTGWIELLWSKQRILEIYLNIAEWGEGIFGLEAASQYHFNRTAQQLTPMQSALLASTLPSPLRYNPARPANHLVERANWNLQQQRRLGGSKWLAPLK